MKHIVATVIRSLLALLMVNSGFNKLFAYMPMPPLSADAAALMGAFVASGYMMGLIALTEIVGGALFALPRTKLLGTLILLPIALNILLFHIFLEPAGLIMAIIIFGINLYPLFSDRSRFLPLLEKKA